MNFYFCIVINFQVIYYLSKINLIFHRFSKFILLKIIKINSINIEFILFIRDFHLFLIYFINYGHQNSYFIRFLILKIYLIIFI